MKKYVPCDGVSCREPGSYHTHHMTRYGHLWWRTFPLHLGLSLKVSHWVDDQVWWHRVRGHKVSGPIIQVAPGFICWANVCHTCDFTWVR
jgi:hypothetical protein